MPDRPLKLRELRRLLRKYDVWEDTSRGRGSHTMFFRRIGDSVLSYPVPRHGKDLNAVYVRNCRRKFQLTAEDGIADAEFYS